MSGAAARFHAVPSLYHLIAPLRNAATLPVRRAGFDYSSMPQGERNEQEQQDFLRMLRQVNLLYLGCHVLVIMDRSYLSRFWVRRREA